MNRQGFILTSAQLLRDGHTRLAFQGRLLDGRRFHWTVFQPRPVFFIVRGVSELPFACERKELELRTLRGEPVDGLYFRTTGDLNRAREECDRRTIPTGEADIPLAARFLMERFIRGAVEFQSEMVRQENGTLYFENPRVAPGAEAPDLRPLSFDIECALDGLLYSIAICGPGVERVYMLDSEAKGKSDSRYETFRTETELLQAFFAGVRKFDPDTLIGWNIVGFDLPWLDRKCAALGLKFDLGTDGPVEIVEPSGGRGRRNVRIPGRAVLDGMDLVRNTHLQPDDYSLATVASMVLGREKLIEKTGREKVEEINRLFREDQQALAAYNLEDARLVLEIFEKLQLLPLTVRRSLLTGLSLERMGGSVAAFDFLYLPRLHRRGFVGDTHPRPPEGLEPAPGGLVLEGAPGFHENVAVFDFKSMYPGIIRTFSIDPLAAAALLHRLIDLRGDPAKGSSDGADDPGGVVRGPAGLPFYKEWAVLPEIIEELWAERDRAKARKDEILSQSVKIIMNSFYGVLGSPGCRFYDPRLAGSITRIGHWILRYSRVYIEEKGSRVIYGDTDSLFIALRNDERLNPFEQGRALAADLNRELRRELTESYGVESMMEIEFEKLFVRFFLPTIRGETTGSKKRYAGLLASDEDDGREGDALLYFAGLEVHRRDWTVAARELQVDLFRLVFTCFGEDSLEEKLGSLIRSRHAALTGGELDDRLIYRKGLSKHPDEYTKNVPPHVRAARMLDDFEGRIIRYVMTVEGPEPLRGRSGAPLDYRHYAEKQLAPVADMVLGYFQTDYRSLTGEGRQLDLF